MLLVILRDRDTTGGSVVALTGARFVNCAIMSQLSRRSHAVLVMSKKESRNACCNAQMLSA